MKKVLLALSLGLVGVCTQTNAQVLFSQSFENATPPSLPSNMAQTSSASPGWVTTSATPSWYFSNIPAHGTYAMVDDYNNNKANTLDRLTTSTVSLVGTTSPYLYFEYFYFQASSSGIAEKAYVQASTDGGTTWTTIDSLTGTNPTAPAWQTVQLSLSAYNTSSNFKIGIVYSDGGGAVIGCAVDNINIVDAVGADLALQSVTPIMGDPSTGYFTVGANATFGGTVLNLSLNAISSFNVTYQVGASPAVTSTITANIPSFGSYTFSIPTPYTVPSVGTYDPKIWVSAPGDVYAGNDSAKTEIYGVSFMPVKKLLVEEATGTWCGWCVRGIVFMDSLQELYGNGDVSLIAVHDGDPMTVSAYDQFVGTKIGGYPSVIIDRREVDDPQNLLGIYNAEHNIFGFADLYITTPTFSGTTVNVGVNIFPAVDLIGDYRVALAITEDDVHNTSGGTWDQHNYYSHLSQNQPLTGQGVNYQDSAAIIPSAGMYYNFVARSITPSPTGNAGVLPTTMTAGGFYSATLTATIDPSWNASKLRGVVMLIRNSDGVVLNTSSTNWALGVSNVNAGINKVLLFPNPASEVAYLKFSLDQSSTINIVVTDAVGRTVYVAPSAQMTTGEQKVTIPTNALAAGVYNVTLSTEKGMVTQRLSVIK